MKTRKRLFLHRLYELEQQHDQCIVRFIEMTVDGILADIGKSDYAPQFWRDVETYGLREASVYLHNFIQPLKFNERVKSQLDELTAHLETFENLALLV